MIGRERLGRIALALGGVLLSAIAIALLAGSVDLSATAATLGRAQFAWLLPILGLLAIQVVLRSARWRALLPPRPDGRAIPLRRIPPVLLIGYLGNAALPARLGELIRAYLIARRERVDMPESFGSVVLERIVDTATVAMVAFVAAVLAGAPGWIVQGTAVVGGGGAVLVVILCTTGLERPIRAVQRRVGRPRRWQWLPGLLDRVARFARGAGGAHRRRTVVLAAGVSTAAWLIDGTTFWLIGRALGIELSPASALLVASVTVISSALPSAPGYVGTFELAAVAVATVVGVDPAHGLALAVLAHALTVLPVALGGVVSLALVGGGVRWLSDTGAAARRASAAPPTEPVAGTG